MRGVARIQQCGERPSSVTGSFAPALPWPVVPGIAPGNGGVIGLRTLDHESSVRTVWIATGNTGRS